MQPKDANANAQLNQQIYREIRSPALFFGSAIHPSLTIKYVTPLQIFTLGADISAHFAEDLPFVRAYDIAQLAPEEPVITGKRVLVVSGEINPLNMTWAENRFLNEVLTSHCTDPSKIYPISRHFLARCFSALTNTTKFVQLQLSYEIVRFTSSMGFSKNVVVNRYFSPKEDMTRLTCSKSLVTLVPSADGFLTTCFERRFIKTTTMQVHSNYLDARVTLFKREGVLGKIAGLGSKKASVEVCGDGDVKDIDATHIMDLKPGMNLVDWHNDAAFSRVTTDEMLNVILSVLSITSRLHRKGIVHRDIKVDNYMIDVTNGDIWLIDLGLAKLQVRDDTAELKALDYKVGARQYRATELFQPNCRTSIESDIYALGVMIFELTDNGLQRRDNLPTYSALGVAHSHFNLMKRPARSKLQNLTDAHLDFLNRQLQGTLAADPKNRPQLCEIKEVIQCIKLERVRAALPLTVDEAAMLKEAGQKAIECDIQFGLVDNSYISTYFTFAGWYRSLRYTVATIKEVLDSVSWSDNVLALSHFLNVLDIDALKLSDISKQSIFNRLDEIETNFNDATARANDFYTERHLQQEHYLRFNLDSACDFIKRIQMRIQEKVGDVVHRPRKGGI